MVNLMNKLNKYYWLLNNIKRKINRLKELIYDKQTAVSLVSPNTSGIKHSKGYHDKFASYVADVEDLQKYLSGYQYYYDAFSKVIRKGLTEIKDSELNTVLSTYFFGMPSGSELFAKYGYNNCLDYAKVLLQASEVFDEKIVEDNNLYIKFLDFDRLHFLDESLS